MNTKAFNITSDINEKELYPEDYILDNTLDKDVFDFFNLQKNDENIFPKKTIIKNNTNFIEKENNFDNEEGDEEEEENSSESSELIYSNFPDNISLKSLSSGTTCWFISHQETVLSPKG